MATFKRSKFPMDKHMVRAQCFTTPLLVVGVFLPNFFIATANFFFTDLFILIPLICHFHFFLMNCFQEIQKLKVLREIHLVTL